MTSPTPSASRRGAVRDSGGEPGAGTGQDDGDDLRASEVGDFETYAAMRWPRLLRIAYLLTNGDHHEAEDLVQATLAKIYLRWHHIRTLDAPDQYVRRALINNNITRQRKRRVVHFLTPQLPEPRSESGDDDHDIRSELFAALATLPPRQRAIVVLRYWECLSEQETARILGCATGTVKSQASRALKKLRCSAALSEYAATTADRD
ncbi:SigE family RNA polymerase sigma factor [Streptomyces cylindrosporus]|uniref:SigE family RNA polymerase sigma factor n=1 Tax=Streptomyces cylindrosporus TaxID=2927583 RepID=A0ABS9YAS4_9ACTN|nr:SigE family RNA polymerase sigma factor [Streptomyces cylindrosporus]MCI3273640.1 SigE family RNA polymerase sigma factor [Streptomyces cylindrosporus]